jgi:hypothetical protein
LKEDRYIELTAGVAITQINLNYEVYDSGGIFCLMNLLHQLHLL